MLSVSKWRRILRGKTETKSAPKRIFSGNGNGLKSFIFLTTWEQKNAHTVYVKQDCVCFFWMYSYSDVTVKKVSAVYGNSFLNKTAEENPVFQVKNQTQ